MEKSRKNYVLIGYQRSGTTWLSMHFRRYYGKEKSLGEWFGETTKISFQEKISFLEDERKKGEEYFIKWMVHQIQNCSEWWNEFYKDYEKIKLLNLNVWDIFLSETYQRHIKWTYTNLWMEKEFNMTNFSVDLKWIKQFVQQYIEYLKFRNYNTIFNYDKITDEYVMNYLGNEEYKFIKIYRKDYEKYLIEDVELIKNCLIKELEKNGINCLQNGKIKL